MRTDSADALWDGVPLCPLHTSDTPGHDQEADPECDGCVKEMEARSAVIDNLQREAQKRMDGLRQAGLQFPPQAVDHIRLELLIDSIIHGRNAYLFEGEAGRRLVETMKAMQREHTSQTIAPDKRLTVVRNGQRPTP